MSTVHAALEPGKPAAILRDLLGKLHPYRQSLGGAATWQLLEAIKRHVDPAGILNPGSLGLD